MAKKNGAQSVETIPGRKIVLSAGVGKTNIDELKWLTDTVLSNAKAWKAKAVCEEIVATEPIVKLSFIGLNEKDTPKLIYNGKTYSLTKDESSTYVSERIINLDPCITDFVIKVGETTETIKLDINTGTTIEDQFADFF